MSLKKNLSDDEVWQIAELHYNLLPDSFLASFGKDFLYLIYQKIKLSVGSTIIVYCINSEVVGFIAGQTAPAGRTMGHAGAIVGGKDDTAQAKMEILAANGIHVVESPAEIGQKVLDVLS